MPPPSLYPSHIRAASATCRKAGVVFGFLSQDDLLQNLWILDAALRGTYTGDPGNYEKHFINRAVGRCVEWSIQTLGFRRQRDRSVIRKRHPLTHAPVRVVNPDDSVEVSDGAGKVLGTIHPDLAWACVSRARGISPSHVDQAMGWTPRRTRNACHKVKRAIGAAA